MKHPFRDRLLILISALFSLLGAIASAALVTGNLSVMTRDVVFSDRTLGIPLVAYLSSWSEYGMSLRAKIALIVAAVVLFIFATLLIGVILPSRKPRSSNFAVQRNENGTVRISLKAIESLVQKCLSQHAELKVVTSSLFSDEESVRVDVHIMLQSDISMPLAISALQQQIKKYLEACSGVSVQEVRVFVEGTTPATADTPQSPYAIPASLLGLGPDALPSGERREQKPATASGKPVNAAPAESFAPAASPAPAEPAAPEPAQSKPEDGAVKKKSFFPWKKRAAVEEKTASEDAEAEAAPVSDEKTQDAGAVLMEDEEAQSAGTVLMEDEETQDDGTVLMEDEKKQDVVDEPALTQDDPAAVEQEDEGERYDG